MFDDLRERATSAEYELEKVEEPQSSSALANIVAVFTPQQRFILSLMLFLNVTVLGCMCLLASGRIQF